MHFNRTKINNPTKLVTYRSMYADPFLYGYVSIPQFKFVKKNNMNCIIAAHAEILRTAPNYLSYAL